jgi:hypothetical protein
MSAPNFSKVSTSRRWWKCCILRPDGGNEVSLWFDEFDWSAIRERVESLLHECEGCVSWDDVIEQLAPHMNYMFD